MCYSLETFGVLWTLLCMHSLCQQKSRTRGKKIVRARYYFIRSISLVIKLVLLGACCDLRAVRLSITFIYLFWQSLEFKYFLNYPIFLYKYNNHLIISFIITYLYIILFLWPLNCIKAYNSGDRQFQCFLIMINIFVLQCYLGCVNSGCLAILLLVHGDRHRFRITLFFQICYINHNYCCQIFLQVNYYYRSLCILILQRSNIVVIILFSIDIYFCHFCSSYV